MNSLLSLGINDYKVLTIFWNIFLALIPCFTVYYLAKSIKNRKLKSFRIFEYISFVLIFLFWLLFLPNTAYLLTDTRHLVNYCSDWNLHRVCINESWMVIFFTTYAFIGVPTFYYSINKMRILLGKLINKKIGQVLPIITIPLISIGVMFGLFERFNSWDVVTSPIDIIKTGLGYFMDQDLFVNFLVFTLCLYFIYYVMGFFIKKITKPTF